MLPRLAHALGVHPCAFFDEPGQPLHPPFTPSMADFVAGEMARRWYELPGGDRDRILSVLASQHAPATDNTSA